MAEKENSTREGSASKRLYCRRYAGQPVAVCDGVVQFDQLGLVVGVVGDATGNPVSPPRPISEEQKRVLEEVGGLVELSAEEVRHLPLQIENERRRREFVDRVTQCIHAARRRLRRWPSIREVQAKLVEFGFPAGRKEKIGEQLQVLKNEQEKGNNKR